MSLSGPKIDEVELERQRQAEIERKRQEKLRRIREETDKLNKEISKSRIKLDNMEKHVLSLVRSVETAEEMKFTMIDLNYLKSAYKTKFEKVLAINIPTEPEDISIYTYNLANETEAIVKDFNRDIKPLDERIKDYLQQLEILESLKAASEKFSAARVEMKPVQDFDFSARVDNIKQSDLEPSVIEKAEQILSDIEEMVNSESIQDSDMQELLRIADNVYKTAFKTKTSFEAAAIEFNVVKSGIARNMAIFDAAYQEYFAEHVLCLDMLYKNKVLPIDAMPIEKYHFASIEDVQNEAKLFAQVSKTEAEKSYIREQIDEVMAMYGYDLSEEIVFNTNHTGNHYICEDGFAQSAIHIYLSEKKQIMMEIVKTEERVNANHNAAVNGLITPSSGLSSHESESLFDEQGRFCELHPSIVEELKKRGVILNAKSRKPPGVEYAKKIVRISIGSEAFTAQSTFINERANIRRAQNGSKQQLRSIK